MSSLLAQFWAARNPPADPKDLYLNKAVLVTGANSGLGHEAAVKYATLGANPLILAVRTEEKGEQAKADIVRRTKCSPDIFSIQTVDFVSFASVKALAERINSRPEPLHVAQVAAGVAQWKYEKSPDGYEMTLQVNVLSQALLTLLLLPKLRPATSSEDVFVPHLSFLHSIAAFEYYLAELALWDVIEGLVERCSSDGSEGGQAIIVNATCPSGCKTNMGRNFPGFVEPILALQHFVCGRTAEQGARTLVGATALGPESQGKLWRNDKLQPSQQERRARAHCKDVPRRAAVVDATMAIDSAGLMFEILANIPLLYGSTSDTAARSETSLRPA